MKLLISKTICHSYRIFYVIVLYSTKKQHNGVKFSLKAKYKVGSNLIDFIMLQMCHFWMNRKNKGNSEKNLFRMLVRYQKLKHFFVQLTRCTPMLKMLWLIAQILNLSKNCLVNFLHAEKLNYSIKSTKLSIDGQTHF